MTFLTQRNKSLTRREMPQECGEEDSEQCSMEIHKVRGNTCEELKDRFGGLRKKETKFATNHEGHSSGMLFGLDSEKSYENTKCKAFVIYGPRSSSNSARTAIGCGMLVPEGKGRNFCSNGNNGGNGNNGSNGNDN